MEFWFFSPASSFGAIDLLNTKIQTFASIAYNDLDCVPMGDGCFNPQLGFIPKSSDSILKGIDVPEKTTTRNHYDVDMITCDENYAFDLFCGKARPTEKVAPKDGLEIWFDVSTSMRRIFPEEKNCLQLQFARKLQAMCGRRPTIKIFNTSVGGETTAESACSYAGLNDQRQLISSIKLSNARKLLIITDTDEYSGELRKLIETHHVPIRGMDLPMPGEQILSFAHELIMYCK